MTQAQKLPSSLDPYEYSYITDAVLADIYGNNFKNKFNLRIRNITTGDEDDKSHHCRELGCEGKPVTRKCFKLKSGPHFAFCTVLLKLADGTDRICGKHFKLNSRVGCIDHKYPTYNIKMKELLRGRELTAESKGEKTSEQLEEEQVQAAEAQRLEKMRVVNRTLEEWKSLDVARRIRERDERKEKSRTRATNSTKRGSKKAVDGFFRKD